jgi:hypothetical protein
MAKNARFWWYCHDWVKITLKPGQTLHHFFSKPTDEGYTAEGVRWVYDDNHVHVETYNDGRDCDGRLERFSESFCPVDKLMSVTYNEAPPLPDWEEAVHSQRDHAAEAMGY